MLSVKQEHAYMAIETRRLYRSPNGDIWHLARGTASGRVFIRHEANAPSGGQVTDIEIGDFLTSGGHGPQHAELLRLIGTLVGPRSDA
jgi:hypothetical protein